MKPGKDIEDFEIKFDNNWCNKNTMLSNNIVELHWFWRMLGFNVWYEAIMLDKPKQVSESYTYGIKLHNKIYYWLNFKLKTIKL